MKKISRICSVMIIAVMLMLSVSAITAGAAGIGKYYTTMDISSAATGKFWVDINSEYDMNTSNYNYTLANGGGRDFVSSIGGAHIPKVVVYPMESISVNQYNPDKAWVLKNNELRSPTGIPYVIPKKTATVDEKEVIQLSDSTWTPSQTVNMKRNLKKVHFIVASAGKMKDDGSTGVKVEAIYTDADNYTQEAATYDIKSYSDATVKEESNALCYLKAYEKKGDAFVAVGDWGGYVVLREFSLDIEHPDAQVSHLKFSQNGTNAGSFAIFAITTEDAAGEKVEGLSFSAPEIKDGSYSLTTSAPYEGEAILAVYNAAGDELVAVGKTELTASGHTQEVTATGAAIKADGTYTARLLLWDDMTATLKPVTISTPVAERE